MNKKTKMASYIAEIKTLRKQLEDMGEKISKVAKI